MRGETYGHGLSLERLCGKCRVVASPNAGHCCDECWTGRGKKDWRMKNEDTAGKWMDWEGEMYLKEKAAQRRSKVYLRAVDEI